MGLPQARGSACFDQLSTTSFSFVPQLCPFALSRSKPVLSWSKGVNGAVKANANRYKYLLVTHPPCMRGFLDHFDNLRGFVVIYQHPKLPLLQRSIDETRAGASEGVPERVTTAKAGQCGLYRHHPLAERTRCIPSTLTAADRS